jgi:hypothetical protein
MNWLNIVLDSARWLVLILLIDGYADAKVPGHDWNEWLWWVAVAMWIVVTIENVGRLSWLK